MARPLKPKTPLAERLVDVRKLLGFLEKRAQFASRLQILPDTLSSYERGVAAPPIDVLALYHREFGVNVSWLVSGEGEPLEAGAGPSEKIVPWTMQRLFRLVVLTCREQNLPVADDVVSLHASELYNSLLAKGVDPLDQDAVLAHLEVLKLEFKRRLEASASEPGTGKRTA